MAKITIDPSIGEEIARRLIRASKGEKNYIVQDYMDMCGWSKGKVYRIARQFGFRGFSKEREDKGKRKVSLDVVHLMGAIMHKSRRKTEKEILCTHDALRHLEDNGVLPPGQISVSTANRYLRENKINRESRDRPTPHVKLRSEGPNHVHLLDSSVCVQYDFKDKGTKWKMVDRDMKMMYYKNKPQYFKLIKKVLLRYVMTDHASGTIYLHYYYVRGEDTHTLVDFVWNAWAPKADPGLFPFQGVPEILITDPGSANISAAFRGLMKNLKVNLIVHAPGNSRAKGSVESAHAFVERYFESELSLEKALDIEDLNARAYDRTMRMNAEDLHKRTGMPRFSCWMMIEQKNLRFLPIKEIYQKLVTAKEFQAVVNGAKQMKIDGTVFEVHGPARQGMHVNIIPDFFNPAQFKVADADGNEFPVTRVYQDRYGFDQTAATIGKEYKSHPYDQTQRFIADVESGKIDTSHIKPQSQRAKVEGLHYLTRPGVPALGAVDAQIPAYSRYEARNMVRERLDLARLTPVQAQLLERYLQEGMSEEQIEAAAKSMRKHMGMKQGPESGEEEQPAKEAAVIRP